MREKQAKYNSGRGKMRYPTTNAAAKGNAQILLCCLSLGVLLISQLFEVLVEGLDLALQILLLRLQSRTQTTGKQQQETSNR